jgi:6-phosphogluconolactonase
MSRPLDDGGGSVAPQTLKVVAPGELPLAAAVAVAGLLSEAIATRSAASLALAGGTTPRAMHEVLATLPDVDWSRVSIYFGDERCVPPDHADSNYRMARESLLTRVPIPDTNVHRMLGEFSDREAAARAYAELVPAALDVIVLGIGEDGHTASLFPGSPALDERERLVLPVIGPKPPPQRLTLTPPVLERARCLLMLASGAGKAEAVARALEGALDPRTTPAQLARGGTWMLDPAAASRLSESVS